MSNFILSEYDFVRISFENFETITFSIDDISDLTFFDLSLPKDNRTYTSNSFELTIKQNGDYPLKSDSSDIIQRNSSFKRIYQASDICIISLETKENQSESVLINISWDDNDSYNYQHNYWQHVELLSNGDLRIFNSPTIDKEIIHSRIKKFRPTHYRTDFDMHFLNETLSDLEQAFLEISGDLTLEEQKEKVRFSLDRLQSFSNNLCFEYHFLNNKSPNM